MSDEKKPVETKVFKEKFGNGITFAVWPVDEEGNKVGEFPIIAFGKRKAEAIMNHVEELEAYVSDK